MRPFFRCLVWLALAATVCSAQDDQTAQPNWKAIVAAQPEGLSLELSLPKTSYHQGEAIEATLTFRNTSKTPFQIWTGGDRSGRAPRIAFFATDREGHLQTDPLLWYFRNNSGDLVGTNQDLGEWSVKLLVNQWVRFAGPGKYTLRALSSRPQPGLVRTRMGLSDDSAELASNPVSIEIAPLSALDERRIIDAAVKELAAGGSGSERPAWPLMVLGTPASREALIPYLNDDWSAGVALCASPDPAAEAPRVLKAVRSGTLKYTLRLKALYIDLKTFQLRPEGPFANDRELTARREAYHRATTVAQEEFRAAALEAAKDDETQYREILSLSIIENDSFRAEAQAELLKRELDQRDADVIFRLGELQETEEFLSLVRTWVDAPHYSTAALEALQRLRPNEARPLVIADLQREQPRYADSFAGGPRFSALLRLPVSPIPELTAHFRRELAKTEPANQKLLVETILRYGEPSLLPDVVRFSAKHAGQLITGDKAKLLRFQIRYDPEGGVRALEQAMADRKPPSDASWLLFGALFDEWNDSALPMVTKALNDADAGVVTSAITLLERHADAAHLPICLAALQRIVPTVADNDTSATYAIRQSAVRLLVSERWKANPDQVRVLQELVEFLPKGTKAAH